MRIIAVEMKNFCQHEDKLVEFTPGLNAILGANGAGKSTILSAIGFCLTGSIGTAGIKADNIRQQAAKTAKSYVRLVFTHGDMNVIVQRNLRPKTPNAIMTINGRDEIVGEAAVDAEIVRILGVPQDVITNMVVVGHGELFGFLHQTQGARLEQFQKLFRLEQAAKLYDGIGKYVSAMTVPVITENMAELQIQATQEQADLDALEKQLSAPDMNIAAVQASLDACAKVLIDADVVRSVKSQLDAFAHEMVVKHSERVQLERSLGDQTMRYDALKAAYDGLDVPAASAAVIGWNAYQSALQAVDGATTRTYEAHQDLIAIDTTEPVRNPEMVLTEAETSALAMTVNATLAKINALHATASLNDGAPCPTCGAPAADVHKRRQDATDQISKLREMHARDSVRVQYNVKHFADWGEWARRRSVADAAYQRAVAAENQLPKVVAVPSCDDAKARVERGAQLTNEMGHQSRSMSALTANIATLIGQLQQMAAQVKSLEGRLAEMRQDSPAVIEAVIEDQANWFAVMQHLRECELKRATLRERVSSTRARITRLEAAVKQVEVVTGFRDLLNGVRGVFHKEAAPALVVQANLHRLQDEINRQLTLFDADYRVQVAEGASFTAMFEGGIVQPVQRLSYGQQVALAFAFRLALNRTIIPQVNGLCFDEPTAYLDRRRIDAFAPVFDHLRQTSQSSGLQCIIVTHERMLSHLFDHVIEV